MRLLARTSQSTQELELNEVYKLIVSGLSDIEIQQKLGISRATFYRFKDKLHTKIITTQLNVRQEDFVKDVEICKSRLILPLRTTEAIMLDPKATPRSKIDAARVYTEVAISLVKVESEGSMYSHGLRSRQAVLSIPRGYKPTNETAVNWSSAGHP